MGVIVPKLRQSARGQPCTLNFPYCNHDPETTVLAHLPSQVKGMGNKGDDWHAVFACSNCHHDLDNRVYTERDDTIQRALQRTQRIWFEMGLMSFPATEPKRKSMAKVVAHPGHIRG